MIEGIKSAVELALDRIDREKEKADELQEQFTIEVMGIVRTYVDSCGLAPEVALSLAKRKLWHALGQRNNSIISQHSKPLLTKNGMSIMKAVIDEATDRVAKEKGVDGATYV